MADAFLFLPVSTQVDRRIQWHMLRGAFTMTQIFMMS